MNPMDVPTVFNLTQYIGLSGVPMIERFVEYLKVEWKLPTYLAPVAATASGVMLNVGLAAYLSLPMANAVAFGFFTGLFSAGWHEIAKK